MNVKNRMVKPRWRKQFGVFENDNLVFKNGIKPLGADASHNTGAPPQAPPLRAGYSSILPARAALAPDGATFLAKICP